MRLRAAHVMSPGPGSIRYLVIFAVLRHNHGGDGLPRSEGETISPVTDVENEMNHWHDRPRVRQGPPRRSLASVLSVSIAVVAMAGVGVATAAPAQASAGDAFDPAAPAVFIAQGTPTQLYKAETSGNGSYAFATEGPEGPVRHSALGFNPADNYLYAMVDQRDTTSLPFGSLIRIGREGVIERVGNRVYAHTGGGNRWSSGAFNPDDGLYYVADSGTVAVNNRTLLAIDVTTGAEVRRIQLPEALLAQDFTIRDGFAWGAGPGGGLRRVNLSNGRIRTFTDVLPATAGGYGAAWTFGNGNIGFSANDTGRVYQVSITDPGSATPSIALVSSVDGPRSDFSDGAAIPGLPSDLSLTVDGPATVVSGTRVEYAMTVTNNGPGVSSGWTVSDTLPSALTNPSVAGEVGFAVDRSDITVSGGRLSAGQSTTFRISAEATAAAGDQISHTATVTNNQADPVPSNNTDTAEAIAAARSYTVEKSADVDSASASETVRYTVKITNTGNVDYPVDTPASFEDELVGVLDDATYNDDATNGATFAGSTLTWIRPLAAGETTTVTYTVTVKTGSAGDSLLTGRLLATGSGGSCGGECASSTPVGSFRVTTTSDHDTVRPGDVVRYTTTVENTGRVPYTVGRPASFADDLSSALAHGSYNDDATEGAVVEKGKLTWSGALDIGETVTVTYSFTVTQAAETPRSPTAPGPAEATCATSAHDAACRSAAAGSPPELATTGSRLWAGGGITAAALSALGLTLIIARRRRGDLESV